VLSSSRSSSILATSRQPLGIAGEATLRVPSLDSPPEGKTREALLQAVLSHDASRLFLDRASVALSGFTASAANASAIALICRQLDGIPLAIELAAARVGVLSVEQIAVRLDDRFRLLTAGSREALPRQQTLRAALDWSYDLLTEQERAVLRRLSVFAGGCSLEAAEAVCSGDGIPPDEVLDLLAKLADKSLLIVDEQGGEARYHLLETVRQYAAGRLGGDASEAECARRAHRDWYLALAERAAPLLRGAEQAVWLDWLEREHANLHAALEWSLTAPGEAATALRLAATLREFWHMRGHPGEGRRWLEAALAVEGDVPPGVRAAGLDGAGILAHSQGDYAAARAFHEESLGLWRRLNDRRGLAVCLNARGIVAMALHDFEGAERSLEESLACWRELGEDGRVAILLNNLGYMAVQRGDYERAETLYQESLEIKRRLHDVTGVAVALNNLGEAARYRGDYTRATALMGESLSLFRELGSAPRVAQVLHSLAMTAQEQGDDRRAGAHLVEGIGIFRQLDDRLGMIQCLEGLAAVAARTGAPARAARLFGAAEAARERIGSPLPLPDRAAHDRAVKTARAALDPTAFAAAWLVGRSLPLAQAADEAAAGRSL
jgi:predicted ATPase